MRHSRVSALLGIQYPIIQASMVWITSAELVAAVSNAGGLGVLGPNAGQRTVTHDPRETAERLRSEIRKTKSLTDKPFAVNYLLPITGLELSTRFAAAIFKVLCEEQVKIVVTSGEESEAAHEEIRRFKEAGFIVLHRELSPTVENSLSAEKMGVDAIIVTGHEAGGHLSNNDISTLALVPQITDAVKLPVIAAGGIYNGKGVKAAFAMGAEGVYMGTRFINTFECPASEACKQEIIRARSDELIELKTPVGNMRTTVNRGLKFDENSTLEEIGSKYIHNFKTGMLDGDIERGVVSVSTSVGGINSIVSCRDVIDEIVAAF